MQSKQKGLMALVVTKISMSGCLHRCTAFIELNQSFICVGHFSTAARFKQASVSETQRRDERENKREAEHLRFCSVTF